jgi:Protein of unknown function (DUF1375)
MKTRLVAVVFCLTLTATGCGTVCNLAGGVVHPDREPRVYGGVQRDLDVIESVVESDPSDKQKCNPKAYLVLIPLAAADPVLSFVADTITLPITIPLQRKNAGNQDSLDKSNEAGSPSETFPSKDEKIFALPEKP